MTTAYCMKCRQKREIKDPTDLKNSLAVQTCPVCGTKIQSRQALEVVKH